jgi:hypothetical protein
MKQQPARAISAFVRRLAVLAALAALGSYLFVALARIDYPFEIEWMEGGSRGHVERIRAGGELYGPPALEFTPFIYPPLYFYVGSWVSPLLGGGFPPLRALSFAASLACFWLVGWLVRRDSGDSVAGLLAAGLFAASFVISGAWFDIARVDSLFLALTLASVCVLRAGSSTGAGVLAGLLGAAAFFTKQTALMVLAPFVAYAVVARGRLWLAFAGTLGAVVAAGCLVLAAGTDGWFGYYVFELPRQHEPRWWKLESFWRLDLLAKLPIAIAAAAVFFAVKPRPSEGGQRLFYLCFVAGAVAASWFSRIHSGGYLNVLMPVHAAVAVLFGLGLAACRHASWGTQPRRVEVLVHGLCVAQFALLAYDPRTQIPDARDRRAGQELVAKLGDMEGEVLVVHHGYLPGLAGKSTSAQWMALMDVLRGDASPVRERLDEAIRSAIHQQRYTAIIIDDTWYSDELEASYRLSGPAFEDDDVFWPRTGQPLRPERIYVRRSTPP